MTEVDEVPPEVPGAVLATISDAFDAALAGTPEEEHRILVDALQAFPGRSGMDPERGYATTWSLVVALCASIRLLDRGGELDNSDGPVMLAADDVTGEGRSIDEVAAGDPAGQGSIAAMRVLVAWCNDDIPGCRAVFDAVWDAEDDGATVRVASMLYTLLRMAGGLAVEKSRREGLLTDENHAALQARRARENSGVATGWESVAIDERDKSPDDRGLASPKGTDCVYGGGVYPAGVVGARDAALDAAHDQIEEAAEAGGYMVCPVRHGEDVEVWELPHTLRPPLRRAIRAMASRSGHRGVVVRAWRHKAGVCPDAAPVVEDTPLFDVEDAL